MSTSQSVGSRRLPLNLWRRGSDFSVSSPVNIRPCEYLFFIRPYRNLSDAHALRLFLQDPRSSHGVSTSYWVKFTRLSHCLGLSSRKFSDFSSREKVALSLSSFCPIIIRFMCKHCAPNIMKNRLRRKKSVSAVD